MKRLLAGILAAAALMPMTVQAQTASQINLTPTPYAMEATGGEGLTLKSGFTIGGDKLSAEMTAEIEKFLQSVALSTGIEGTMATTASGATIQVSTASEQTVGTEGYTLSVTPAGAKIGAATSAGLYYAFQTVKKLLPANVMAEVRRDGTYTIPAVEITDRPTFSHRGFELDCARHFHSLDQVKRMLDIMSYYKMNRFHWHLTDDQGWRVEIEKYPRLLTVGSISPDVYLCDFATRTGYLAGQPYGPYYYTKDEMREIVAYAAERHIEVFPEIDMPGHMVAAIAAYPEFSCDPDGEHTIWYRPGVSSDVLDVSNPAVVQFCKDVVSELAEVFPSKLFHIGGDETPTTAWEKSASCQAFMAEHGMTSARQLQSWFTHEMSEHIKSLGKQAVCWNEVVTANGADLDLAKEAGMLIYDWLGGGTAKAAQLGLNSVYCNTSRYYLDYPQGNNNEPRSMGGVVTLPTTYAAYPDVSSPGTVIGVQGNLWTEYISDPRHVEYNALPRLIAIAETGWSPREKKDFSDFQRRITADTTLWNLRGYAYGTHDLLMAQPDNGHVMPDPSHWVTIQTRATSRGRANRVLELVADGSPLISSNGAAAGQLWSAAASDNSDWQQWRFEPDPSGTGRMALICKARPEGSVNPNPGSSSTDARWTYDNTTRHYDFILGEGDYYGQTDGHYYYSIRSQAGDGFWLNCGTDASGEQLTINCWNNPADGDGGLWTVIDPLATAPDGKIYPQSDHWVTVQTRATGRNRAGRVVELVAEGSAVIAECGAEAGRLWSAAKVEGSDWQQWRFAPDPSGSGLYAMICKAQPEGSVNPDPGSTSTDARWSYDPSTIHYNFILGEGDYYGKTDGGYYYSIRSNGNSGYWLNCGTDAAGEKLTLNCWNNPADGDGGLWLIIDPLASEDDGPAMPAFTPLQEGKTYIFVNAAERFAGAMLADDGQTTATSTSRHDAVVWRAGNTSTNSRNIQSLTLTNVATGKAIAGVGQSVPVPNGGGFFNDYYGFAITLGDSPATLNLYRNAVASADYSLTIDGKGLTATPTSVNAGGAKDVMNAVAGGAWMPKEVNVVNIECVDKDGNSLMIATYAMPVEQSSTDGIAPQIKGYECVDITVDMAALKAKATYERRSYAITYECRTTGGLLISREEVEAPAGKPYTVALPDIPYFSAVKSTPASGTEITVDSPTTITAEYQTDALLGAKDTERSILDPAELKDGMTILIYDAHAGGRAAFRMANKETGKVAGGNPSAMTPAYIWTLEKAGSGWNVFNPFVEQYVGPITIGNTMSLADAPTSYNITLNASGTDWQIGNANGSWDGGGDLTLHGWTAPGHPYHLYAPVVAPYYRIAIEEVNGDDQSTLAQSERVLPAGSSFIYMPREREGLGIVKVDGTDALETIDGHRAIRVVYSADPSGIENIEADQTAGRKSGIYDLSGRRLRSASAPGIYIIDGRKVLVK